MRKSWSSAFLCLSLVVLFAGCGGGGGGGDTGPVATPPTVSSTTPVNLAIGVAVNAAISVTFSEAMDPLTVTTSTFTVKAGLTPVSGTVNYSGTVATFTPTVNFSSTTSYTATVTTGAKDLAGNALASNYVWSFTTGTAPDTTPPTVSSTTPVNLAIGVAVNAAISVTFSEAMDPLTVTAPTFTVKAGLTPVSGTVNYSGTTATFTPTDNLAYSTSYTATVTTLAKDLAGNALASNYVWSFTTGTNPDATPPTVSSTTPVNLAIGVAVNAVLSVTFSEAMAPLTVTTSTFKVVKADLTTVPGTVNYSGTTATFTPTDNLAYFTSYTATVTTGAKDLAGNALASNYIWSFTTRVHQMGGSIQGSPLSLSGVVSTLAGRSPIGFEDGTGSAARFDHPTGITTDGTNLYVADANNHTIRKVVIATGVVSTLAGTAGSPGTQDGAGLTTARFDNPTGLTTDGTNLYVSDTSNQTIRKVVIATGVVSTLAGTAGSSGITDGAGLTIARFNNPNGIATDGTNLYVADYNNHTIRKVVIATGVVSTLAGTAGSSGATDNTGLTAKFNNPDGIATDGTNLYVADFNNHTIRKVVIATGVVTTLAGTAGSPGPTDGTGLAAMFNNPDGITTDGTNLYVSDYNNHTVRKVVIATGVVTTLAGTAGSPGTANGAGPAARFNNPTGVTTAGTSLYVVDTRNHTIRKVVIATGDVTTLAGTTPGSANGPGSTARFDNPNGITTDGTNLFVADYNNHTIRKVVIATGVVSTLAGTAGSPGATDATGSAARFSNPTGITTDGTNLYVSDKSSHTIRKVVITTGVVSTLAGTAGSSGTVDGTGSAARFDNPTGITTDGTSLYVTDYVNHTIRKVVIATGVVTTLAGTAGSPDTLDGTGPAARFNLPNGITTDGTNLYVADYNNHTIRKVVIATVVVTTLAGTAGSPGPTDGTGLAAKFFNPTGITTDTTNLYVSDYNNHMIRKVVIATGVVTTLAGTAGSPGATDGTGLAAMFNNPAGITTDGTSLYVADYSNHTIRKVE